MIWQSPVSIGDLLTTLAGTGRLDDFAIGTTYLLEVDHSGDFAFGMCPMPEFVVPDGVLVRVLAETTDGGQFAVELENVSYATDLGYGGADPDVPYSWTRRGTA
jgi:hypothetical protein